MESTFEELGLEKLEFSEKIVHIRRVAKVVKGGRRFSFSSIVVVGNGAGLVGVGLGKANEVPEAIRKAGEHGRKNLIRIPMKDSTIPHLVYGKFGASNVMLRPAPPGTGVIAGGAVRAILEAAGIKDITAKSIGSNNPHNVVRATINGLKQLLDPDEVMEYRGKTRGEWNR